MGESLDRGHVMIFSLWDDVEVNMLWLDSAFPLDKPETDPGVRRGDCVGGESSTPTYLRENYQMAMSPSQMLPLVKLVRQYLVSLLPKHLPKHQPSLRLGFQTVATLSTTKIVFILALTPVPVSRPGFLT